MDLCQKNIWYSLVAIPRHQCRHLAGQWDQHHAVQALLPAWVLDNMAHLRDSPPVTLPALLGVDKIHKKTDRQHPFVVCIYGLKHTEQPCEVTGVFRYGTMIQ